MNLSDVIDALRGTGTVSMMHCAKDPDVWKAAAASPLLQPVIQGIGTAADVFRGTPIPELPYRYYRTFDRNGSRQEYEEYYFGHRKRLNTFALLSLLEPSNENLTELGDSIWAVCDEFSWCLPAHMEGKSMDIVPEQPLLNEKGMFMGIRSRQDRMIDLFGAETGFALAEITSLLNEKLDPFLCFRARSLVFERILMPYLNVDTDRRDWENGTANWTAVCAGSVGAAALYLVEEPALLGRIVYRVMNSMETFLEGYGPDGGCLEGLSYWNYGFGFFVYFADLLRDRTGGKIDLLQGEQKDKICKIMTFQQKCFLHGRTAVCFSDAPRENWYAPGLTHYLHRRNPDVVIPPAECMAVFGDDGCHRWAADLRNLVWTDPAWTGGTEEKEAFYRLEDAQWVILKNGGISFACKGGHNGEPHNHNDVGSFILHAGGDTFLADVGVGMHSRQYFGPQRYTFFTASSLGHSLPIIDGQGQAEGRQYCARGFETERDQNRDRIGYEIGGAYRDANIRGIRRLFLADKSGGGLTLQDTFSFMRAPECLTERIVTMLPPTQEKEGSLYLEGTQNRAVLKYDAVQWKLTVHTENFKPSRDDVNTAYCLDFSARKPACSVQFELEVTVQKKI